MTGGGAADPPFTPRMSETGAAAMPWRCKTSKAIRASATSASASVRPTTKCRKDKCEWLLILALPCSALLCSALRARRRRRRPSTFFCCVKRAEENEINHIQARERRGEERRGEGAGKPEAQSKRRASRSQRSGGAVGKKFSVKRRAY